MTTQIKTGSYKWLVRNYNGKGRSISFEYKYVAAVFFRDLGFTATETVEILRNAKEYRSML